MGSILEKIAFAVIGSLGTLGVSFVKRQWSKARAREALEAVPLIKNAGLALTPAQIRTAQRMSQELLPPSKANFDPAEAALAVEAMQRAIAASEGSGSDAEIKPVDLEAVERLVEMLLNQLIHHYVSYRWLYDKLNGFDPDDPRWPLLKAINDAQALKTLKFMRLLKTKIVETDSKEISSFPNTIDVDKLREVFERLAEICEMPHANRQDFRDNLDYWTAIEPDDPARPQSPL